MCGGQSCIVVCFHKFFLSPSFICYFIVVLVVLVVVVAAVEAAAESMVV